MIQKHKDLGDLTTTNTEWYRPLYSRWEQKDLDKFEEENGVVFCVVEQSGGYGGTCVWGFSKLRPLESLIKENGKVLHKEEKWNGKYLGIRFDNDEIIKYQPNYNDEKELDYFDNLSLVICNVGRCEGIINMEGDRCDKRQHTGNFCATCKKYNDKVKTGKLRECKYCSSTYHSTRSCELNPKVIAEKERFDAILRRMEMKV